MAGAAEQIEVAVGHALLQRTAAARAIDPILDAPKNQRRVLQLRKARIAGEVDGAKIRQTLGTRERRTGDDLRINAAGEPVVDHRVGNRRGVVDKVLSKEGRELFAG